jgi:hypothetical protein
MAELTPQQLQQFQKDLQKLNTLKRQLGEKPLRIEASADNLNLLNDALERTEDLVDNINDGAKGLATSWRNVIGEIKKTNEGYRIGVGSLNKLKDISDKLRLNQKGISELSSKDIQSLQRKQKLETENLKFARDILSEKIKSGKYTEEEFAAYANINNQLNLNNSALKQQNELLKIQYERTRRIEKAQGLTGAALKGAQSFLTKIGASNFAQVFEDASDAAKAMAEKVTKGGTESVGLIGKTRVLAAAFKVAGKEILKNLVDPLILGGLAIKGLKAGFDFLKAGYEEGRQAAERISEENTSIARSLGLAQGAATKLASRFAGIGPTVAASKQSIEAIYSALGSTEKLSDNTLKTFIKLNTFAGFSADALANFQTFAKLSAQDAGQMVTNMANVALNSIKVNKLAISQKQLLTDVSNTSATIQVRFARQPEALVKSVVAAKKLGLEMDKLEGIAESLLNFEDSIAAEMEAELLTGKQLNFEKARELALQGKTAEAAQLLVDQVGGVEEFNKLNIIQQEALAKTLGMNRDGFSEMLLAQEKNVNAAGSLVDTQKDGMQAMMSGQSEAENNTERERRNQESQIAYYETSKQLVRDIKDAWIEIRGIISESITDNLIKPFMAWFNSAGGQTFIKDTLPNAFRDAAKFVKDELVPGIKTVVETLSNFIKENPNIAKAIAGGLAVEAGGQALTGQSVTGTVLSKGGDLLGNLLGKTKIGKFFGLGKNDGQSPTQALWVKMAEGMGFGNQGNRRNQPGRNNRRPGRRPQPRPGGPGGGGGGLFSKIGQGFKSVTSSVGKGLKNVTGSVGKAVSGINPLSALKKGLTSNAGKFIGKAAKGGLIGALLNVGSLASILAGDGTPQQKAEQIIPLAASIIGGSLGSIAGSIVPVVGTIGGGVLGGLIGDYIGNIPAIQKALAPPLAKVLGGDDVAEDFIMQGGKIQKFRKDDIVMGGTNLTGSDPKMIQLLERLIAAVEKGGIVTLDGQKVGTALNIGAYRLQ